MENPWDFVTRSSGWDILGLGGHWFWEELALRSQHVACIKSWLLISIVNLGTTVSQHIWDGQIASFFLRLEFQFERPFSVSCPRISPFLGWRGSNITPLNGLKIWWFRFHPFSCSFFWIHAFSWRVNIHQNKHNTLEGSIIFMTFSLIFLFDGQFKWMKVLPLFGFRNFTVICPWKNWWLFFFQMIPHLLGGWKILLQNGFCGSYTLSRLRGVSPGVIFRAQGCRSGGGGFFVEDVEVGNFYQWMF